jgi:hypothetical protein
MTMDERQRRRDGSKRAQASRERRVGAKARRKKMNTIYGIGAAMVVATITAAIVLFQSGEVELGVKVAELDGQHTAPYSYNQQITIKGEPVRIPPTSGNHFAVPSVYGFLGVDLIPEAVVHNMEHGSVVLWYQPGDAILAGQINQLVQSLSRSCIVAGSYADQSFMVTATIWGRALPQKTYDESALRAFINDYRGEKGPEAGICWNE